MKKLFIFFLLFFTACSNGNSDKSRSKFSGHSGKRAFVELYSSKIDFPYTLTATIITKVVQISPETEDSPPKSIEYTENIMLSRDQTGNYHGHRFLEDGDGIRFISYNQTFCTGFRYEKYICKPEEKNELKQKLKNLWSSFTSSLKPVKHLIQNQKNNTGKTVVYTISKKNSSLKRPPETAANFKILKSTGTIKTDSNNLPLTSKFNWQASLSKNKKKYKITLIYEHEIKKTSQTVKLPDPKDTFPYHKRKRPLQLRKKLLGKKTPPALEHIYGN
ncbi:MAG: hypothetical protein ACQES9_03980 [Myxococcota bacterium]